MEYISPAESGPPTVTKMWVNFVWKQPAARVLIVKFAYLSMNFQFKWFINRIKSWVYFSMNSVKSVVNKVYTEDWIEIIWNGLKTIARLLLYLLSTFRAVGLFSAFAANAELQSSQTLPTCASPVWGPKSTLPKPYRNKRPSTFAEDVRGGNFHRSKWLRFFNLCENSCRFFQLLVVVSFARRSQHDHCDLKRQIEGVM